MLLLAACAALLAAGLSTGVPVYYALSAAAGGLCLACLLADIWMICSLRIKTQAGAVRTRRGESVEMQIKARHSCPLPVGTVEISLLTGSEPAVMEIGGAPFKWQTHAVDLPCPHRGVYMAGASGVAVSDVFALFRLSKKLGDCTFTIEVAPRLRTVPAMELGAGDTGAEAPSRSTEDADAPSGIREWRDGDSLKKIHWKLSMRKREPIVRTYDESAKPDFLILMDLSPIGALRSQELAIEDAACEAAAAAAMAHLAEGYPVRMPLSCSRPVECMGRAPEDLPRFVDALTTTPFDCRYPFEKLLAVEMRRMQRTGGAVLITSRLTVRTADIAMQMRRSGLHVRLNWITESRGGDANEIVARLALSGVEVTRINPNS